jgi:arylsulfatase A-like enzyme
MESQVSQGTGRGAEPIRILKISVWFAILAAASELGILAYRIYIEHRPSFGLDERTSLWADYRMLWMVPVAEVTTLLLPALLIALWARRRPASRALSVGVGVAAGLALISVLFSFTWLYQGAVLLLGIGFGVQMARLGASRAEGLHRLVGRTLGWMVGAVVLASGGVAFWHGRTERQMLAELPAAPATPNVLLIILDTVRDFNLSAYGYQRPTTPNIQRLAGRGVRFEQAYSTAPWTLPSHASIFTGRFPHELTADMLSPLDGTWPTLAEIMRARGYVTAGFVGNTSFCLAESGLARGFVHYEDFVLSPGLLLQSSAIVRILISNRVIGPLVGVDTRLGRKDADRINGDFLHWLPAAGGRPFFVFLNYFDAHRPYLPPPPYDLLYSSSRKGRIRVMGKGSKTGLPPEASRVLTDAYDGALTYLDDRIGRLLAELERRGALKNTIVIITADHGEQFGEHGLFFHANSLYTQLLQVPLVILGSDRIPAGATVPEAVSLRDLAPTVLDLVDHGGPAPFPGRSLARYWENRGAGSPETGPLGAELGRQARLIQDFAPKSDGVRAILVNGMHFIKGGKGRKRQGQEELFDLTRDPREERNLAGSATGDQLLGQLRITLDSMLPPTGTAAKAAAQAPDTVGNGTN